MQRVRPRIVVSLITAEQEFQLLQAADARETAAGWVSRSRCSSPRTTRCCRSSSSSTSSTCPKASGRSPSLSETVAGEGLERVARNAVSAGIGWLLLNRHVPYLEKLRQERTDLPVAMVGTDQEEVGRIQARQFRALLPKGGSVLYVQGPADTSVAQERLRGARGRHP